MEKISFGEKLQNVRISKGYSQEMLASLLGVSRQCISHYESNRRIPNMLVLSKLASVLELPIDTLINLLPTEKNSSYLVRESSFILGIEKNSIEYTNITPLEKHLLDMFRALNDSDRDKLLAFSENLIIKYKK